MAITNEVDLTHIARTTEQWENTYDRNVIIPEGVLCIEFTPSGKTNIKIGDGHHIFSRLPYVNGSSEIIDCYTKQETDNRIIQILNNECVVRIKGILDDASKLPVHAACGDLWFVIRQNPEQGNKFEEYLYSSEHHWELVGGTPVDIDLSKYATKEYVDGKIRDIENKLHTHDNKSILDQITAAFTKEEKEKLKNLYNYDDTELRELIAKSLHTHSNKEVLDAITKYDIDKLRTLENYDDTLLKKKITALEALAHEHSNKSILDKTTASFTTDYERLMSLIRLYIGATGFDDGAAGLVPPAKAGEQNYVLTGSGKWVPNTGGSGETYELPIASATELGGIKIGEGLEISEDGTLSVIGGGSGGGNYNEGNGIKFKQEAGKPLYRVLEYIEATGTQRIDTDIMLTGTSHVVDITYQFTDISVDNYLYTVGGIFDTGGQVYGILRTNSQELCSGVGQGGQAYNYVAVSPPTEKTSDTYFVNSTSFGSTLTGSKDHQIPILNDTISFFGFIRNTYTNYLGKVKLYGCTVKCDDVIKANFIPVMRISDNVSGLYDTVSKKFFTDTYNETPFVTGNPTEEVISDYITTINVKPATTTDIGGIIVGDGLTVTEEGILSVSDDINNSYHAGLGINITEEPIPGDIELDILNNEHAGWENFTYLWTGGAEYEETNYVLHTTRDRIADESSGAWLTHFKLPDGVERIKVEAAAKDGTPLKFWIDNHDSETLYRWSLLGRWYDSGETTDYPDEYKPALLKYNYISIGLCFDTDNTRTISIDDIDYVRLYFIEADKENPKGMGKYINSNIATDYQLGGVIIGKGINVDKEGVISVDAIPLEPATADKLGGVKIGEGLTITEDGVLSVNGGSVSPDCVTDVSLKEDAPGGQEKLYLTSDSEIYFYTNCNTIGDRKGMTLNTSLHLYPNTNNIGSVGTSSNKWASMYATTFYGALSGNANTATTANFLQNAMFYSEASDADSKRYYRVAYAKTTGTYVDMNAIFLITNEWGQEMGIIKVRARTEGTVGVFGGSKFIEWVLNAGFDPAMVKLVVKNNYDVDTAKNGTATAEVWLDNNAQYKGIKFTILSQGFRTGSSKMWTMSSKSSGGNTAMPTTGVTSTITGTNKSISNNTGSSSKVYSTNTPGSSTHAGYSIPFFSGPIDSSSPEKNDTAASGNKTILHNGEFRLGLLEGTTSADGYAQLVLGNGIASGTAGNKYGKISLYSSSTYAVQIIPAKVTSTRTLTLPNASGTVALTSHTHSYIPTSSAKTLFSGTAAASITMTSMSGYKRLVVFCKNTSNSSYFTVELQCVTGYHYHAMTISPPPAAQTSNSFYGLLFNLSSETKLSVSAGKYSNLSSSASLANGPTVHITKVIGYKF